MYDDDRTQVWILRAPEPRRASAVRGGVAPDARARRQSAAAVAGAFIVLLLLPLLTALPRGQDTPPDVRRELRLASATGRVAATPLPAAPVLPPARFLSAAVPEWRRVLAPWLPLETTVSRGGSAAPFAPIWLDTHPQSSADVAAGAVPGATLPRPASGR